MWPFSLRKDAAVRKQEVQKARIAFCSGHFALQLLPGDGCSPAHRGLLSHAAASDPHSKGNKHTPFQLGLRSLDCFLKRLKEHFQNYQRNRIIYLCLILWELARGLQAQVRQCKRLFVHTLLSAAAWLTEDTMRERVIGAGVALPGESKHMKANRRSYVLGAIFYVLGVNW